MLAEAPSIDRKISCALGPFVLWCWGPTFFMENGIGCLGRSLPRASHRNLFEHEKRKLSGAKNDLRNLCTLIAGGDVALSASRPLRRWMRFETWGGGVPIVTFEHK